MSAEERTMAIEPKLVIRKALAEKIAASAKTPATALKEAADAAQKARLAGDPKATPYRFAINYRLDKTTPSGKGDYTKRYNALLVLLKTLGGKQWHYATSSWETTNHLPSQTLLEHLTASLDEKIDVLVVTPISASRVFGDPTKLQV